jgi:8-oxo-dGTP pyrophosphatase MutT (NUDIX family)
VAVVAMDEAKNIVMVYQYRHPVGRRLWELPAGLLDLGGEPAHITAARELKEEAGLEAAEWRVLVDMVSAPGFSDESVRIYLATGITDVGRPDAHDEEADLQVRWFSIEQARRMVLDGEIVNSLAIGGILAAHDVEDPSLLRAVDAPWIDKSKAFAKRQAEK